MSTLRTIKGIVDWMNHPIYDPSWQQASSPTSLRVQKHYRNIVLFQLIHRGLGNGGIDVGRSHRPHRRRGSRASPQRNGGAAIGAGITAAGLLECEGANQREGQNDGGEVRPASPGRHDMRLNRICLKRKGSTCAIAGNGN